MVLVFKVLVSLFGFPAVKSVVILFLLSLWGILFDATGEGSFLSSWLQSKPVKYNSAHMWLICAGVGWELVYVVVNCVKVISRIIK